MSALAATDIHVNFGGVVACDGVSLRVEPAQAVGLTGPNGSGKSTFLNAVTGLVPAQGELSVSGTSVPLGEPRLMRAHGVVRAFQSPQNYAALTALENVALGCADHAGTGITGALLRRRAMLRAEQQRWSAAAAALAHVGLAAVADQLAGALTYGQQRLVELARSIVAQPTVLMLDEPSAGLNATETAHLGEVLNGLRAQGMSLVVVDHKIDFLDQLCQQIIVMQLGRVIAADTPGRVWRDQSVIDAYLGTAEVDR